MATTKQLRNQLRAAGMFTEMRDGRISVLYPVKIAEKQYSYNCEIVYPDAEIVSLFIENRILPEFKNGNR